MKHVVVMDQAAIQRSRNVMGRNTVKMEMMREMISLHIVPVVGFLQIKVK